MNKRDRTRLTVIDPERGVIPVNQLPLHKRPGDAPIPPIKDSCNKDHYPVGGGSLRHCGRCGIPMEEK